MSRMPFVALLLAAGACSAPAAAPVPRRRARRPVAHLRRDRRSSGRPPTPFRLEKVADGMTPGGYYYAANNFFTSEHGGTHLDAPVHFAQGRQTVDQIPLERLIGAAVVIDVTDAAATRTPTTR